MSIAVPSKPERAIETLQATLHAVQARHERVEADALVADWLEILAETVQEREPRGSGMTAAQEDRLVRSGALSSERLASAKARVAGGSLVRRLGESRAHTLADSLTPSEVSTLLHIDQSTVSHRRSDGGLYSFTVGRGRRYPSWQFVDGGGVLPGLAVIVKSIPKEMHPTTVRGIMTTPQPTMRAGGASLTPRDWLVGGGDVERVTAVFEGTLQG